VRHGLEQTEQQVTGLLERARETADELTTSAQREAETAAEAVRAKAAELLVSAKCRGGRHEDRGEQAPR
jgi:F0F1-type ATP synthase membrane subunit b/b'